MKITSVKVHITEKEDSRMKGIASVIIDDCFAIHDIRIIEGVDRTFIAMPSRKTPSGEYRDVANPITSECRTMFEEAVLKAYEDEKKNA